MVKSGEAPVKLFAVQLPSGLPEFLDSYPSQDNEPVICYNTFIRMYLADRGSALRRHLAGWAGNQDRPIVWIQWEPASCLATVNGISPHQSWLAWTIDLWHRGETEHWQIAWVHPHGQQVHWLPDMGRWLKRAKALYE